MEKQQIYIHTTRLRECHHIKVIYHIFRRKLCRNNEAHKKKLVGHRLWKGRNLCWKLTKIATMKTWKIISLRLKCCYVKWTNFFSFQHIQQNDEKSVYLKDKSIFLFYFFSGWWKQNWFLFNPKKYIKCCGSDVLIYFYGKLNLFL